MRVLITGATGFIGQALARALLCEGHELVCAVREPRRLTLAPGRWRALRVDLAEAPPRDWWRAQLSGIDAVINAVGILREAPGQSFEALHSQAPAELFRACVEVGVSTVIQISALGADEHARSRYHLSKKVADDVLRALPLRGAVVQPSVVYGAGGASAAMFNRMAAAPLLALPQSGRMPVQPVHVEDVAAAVVALLAAPPPRVSTLALVGPEPLALADYLRALRRMLQVPGPLPVLPLPTGLFMAGARLAGHVPGSLLDAETAGMLLRGNTASAQAVQGWLGRPPRGVSRFIEAGQVEPLRAQAVLGVWRPLLRVALAFLWIWTAVVSLGLYPVHESYALLGRVGLTGMAASVALYGAALLNLLLGVLTLACPARWRRALWLGQMGLIVGYTALISLFLPEYWLHPYGPISKNLPLLASIGLLWALEPGARLRR